MIQNQQLTEVDYNFKLSLFLIQSFHMISEDLEYST